jgi:pilus assembly protein CpaF
MMVGMGGFDLPMWIIRRQIASAIQVVVQAARLTGGARKVVKVSEVTGMEGEVISMHDLFVFKQTGVDSEGHAQGYYQATGMRPRCLDRLASAGIHLPVEMFERRTMNP